MLCFASRFEGDLYKGINYVITLCSEEVCPIIMAPRAQKLNWPFADPAGHENLSEKEKLQLFGNTRDAIKKKIEEFKKEKNL